MGITNLSDIRALSSFRKLIEYASKTPWKARSLIDACSSTEEAYPKTAAVYYLLGLIRGSLNSDNVLRVEKTMEVISKTHESLLDVKPADYFGDKRKFGRDGPANGR